MASPRPSMMASMRYSHKYNSGVVLPRIGAATPACSPAHPKAAALPRPRQREAAPSWRRPLGWSRGAGRLVVVVRVGVQVDVVDEVEGRAAVVEAGLGGGIIPVPVAVPMESFGILMIEHAIGPRVTLRSSDKPWWCCWCTAE